MARRFTCPDGDERRGVFHLGAALQARLEQIAGDAHERETAARGNQRRDADVLKPVTADQRRGRARRDHAGRRALDGLLGADGRRQFPAPEGAAAVILRGVADHDDREQRQNRPGALLDADGRQRAERQPEVRRGEHRRADIVQRHRAVRVGEEREERQHRHCREQHHQEFCRRERAARADCRGGRNGGGAGNTRAKPRRETGELEHGEHQYHLAEHQRRERRQAPDDEQNDRQQEESAEDAGHGQWC
jgi:hypothetical protein